MLINTLFHYAKMSISKLFFIVLVNNPLYSEGGGAMWYMTVCVIMSETCTLHEQNSDTQPL